MYWTGENAANTVVAHFRRRQRDGCRAACWQYFLDNVDWIVYERVCRESE